MSRALRVGISTCPNDTYAFHALLSGAVRARGLELAIELADVEELNRRMAAGELDLAKVSAAAAIELAERVVFLSAGWALGFGNGPLLLATAPHAGPLPEGARVLAPGRSTTATLLFRSFHPEPVRLEQTVFSAILPALAAGKADFGVCIHEARFTWRERGVHLVEDLGARWEERTGLPLALGGLVARRALGEETQRSLETAVRASLEWAREHPQECLPTMRRHAQEQEDSVLWSHVELYVNEHTLELGPAGREALRALARLARAGGPASGPAELAFLGEPRQEPTERQRTANSPSRGA